MADRRDRMSPGSGKILKADDSVLDLAALLEAVYDVASHAIKTTGGGGAGSEVDANLQVGGAPVTAANPVPVSLATGGFAPMNATADLAGYSEIIASPGAGWEIIVAGFTMQAIEGGTQRAVLCVENDNTAGFVGHFATTGDGLRWVFPAGNEWHLGQDKALQVHLSADLGVEVTVYYKTAEVLLV